MAEDSSDSDGPVFIVAKNAIAQSIADSVEDGMILNFVHQHNDLGSSDVVVRETINTKIRQLFSVLKDRVESDVVEREATVLVSTIKEHRVLLTKTTATNMVAILDEVGSNAKRMTGLSRESLLRLVQLVVLCIEVHMQRSHFAVSVTGKPQQDSSFVLIEQKKAWTDGLAHLVKQVTEHEVDMMFCLCFIEQMLSLIPDDSNVVMDVVSAAGAQDKGKLLQLGLATFNEIRRMKQSAWVMELFHVHGVALLLHSASDADALDAERLMCELLAFIQTECRRQPWQFSYGAVETLADIALHCSSPAVRAMAVLGSRTVAADGTAELPGLVHFVTRRVEFADSAVRTTAPEASSAPHSPGVGAALLDIIRRLFKPPLVTVAHRKAALELLRLVDASQTAQWGSKFVSLAPTLTRLLAAVDDPTERMRVIALLFDDENTVAACQSLAAHSAYGCTADYETVASGDDVATELQAAQCALMWSTVDLAQRTVIVRTLQLQCLLQAALNAPTEGAVKWRAYDFVRHNSTSADSDLLALLLEDGAVLLPKASECRAHGHQLKALQITTEALAAVGLLHSDESCEVWQQHRVIDSAIDDMRLVIMSDASDDAVPAAVRLRVWLQYCALCLLRDLRVTTAKLVCRVIAADCVADAAQHLQLSLYLYPTATQDRIEAPADMTQTLRAFRSMMTIAATDRAGRGVCLSTLVHALWMPPVYAACLQGIAPLGLQGIDQLETTAEWRQLYEKMSTATDLTIEEALACKTHTPYVWLPGDTTVRQVRDAVAAEVFKDDKRSAFKHAYASTRNVVQAAGLHWKEYVEYPGRERAYQTLAALTIGSKTHTPTAMVCMSVAGTCRVVQLSVSMEGPTLEHAIHDVQWADVSLDMEHYSNIVLLAMLVNPEDGKPDAYVVQTGALARIIPIDNDHLFVPAAERSSSASHDGVKVLVKTVLYCLPQMLSVIDADARRRFLALNAADVVCEWLLRLQAWHQRTKEMFGTRTAAVIQEMYKSLQHKDGLLVGSMVEPYLHASVVQVVMSKMQRMQRAMRANPQLTHMQLLAVVEPVLANIYSEARRVHALSPFEQFRFVEKDQYTVVRGAVPGVRGSVHPLAHMVTIVGKLPVKVTDLEAKCGCLLPGAALKALRKLLQQQARMKRVVELVLQKRNAEALQLLPDSSAANVALALDWERLMDLFMDVVTVDEDSASAFWRAFAKFVKRSPDFGRDVKMVRFRGAVWDKHVMRIVEHCSNIEQASFLSCGQLSVRSIYPLVRTARGLTTLNLSKCRLSELKLDVPTLVRLNIASAEVKGAVILTMPMLETCVASHLTASRLLITCPLLRHVDVYGSTAVTYEDMRWWKLHALVFCDVRDCQQLTTTGIAKLIRIWFLKLLHAHWQGLARDELVAKARTIMQTYSSLGVELAEVAVDLFFVFTRGTEWSEQFGEAMVTFDGRTEEVTQFFVREIEKRGRWDNTSLAQSIYVVSRCLASFRIDRGLTLLSEHWTMLHQSLLTHGTLLSDTMLNAVTAYLVLPQVPKQVFVDVSALVEQKLLTEEQSAILLNCVAACRPSEPSKELYDALHCLICKCNDHFEAARIAGIGCFLEAMQLPPADVVEWACSALGSVVMKVDNIMLAARLGAIECILDVMRQHSLAAAVIQPACLALAKMCLNEHNRTRAVCLGAMDSALQLVLLHLDNKEAMHCIACALEHLCD